MGIDGRERDDSGGAACQDVHVIGCGRKAPGRTVMQVRYSPRWRASPVSIGPLTRLMPKPRSTSSA
jgi:hypothetical protein